MLLVDCVLVSGLLPVCLVKEGNDLLMTSHELSRFFSDAAGACVLTVLDSAGFDAAGGVM